MTYDDQESTDLPVPTERRMRLRSVIVIVIAVAALLWGGRFIVATARDTNGRVVITGEVRDPSGTLVPDAVIVIGTRVAPADYSDFPNPADETRNEVRIRSRDGRFTADVSGFGSVSIRAHGPSQSSSNGISLSEEGADIDWLGRRVWRRENLRLVIEPRAKTSHVTD